MTSHTQTNKGLGCIISKKSHEFQTFKKCNFAFSNFFSVRYIQYFGLNQSFYENKHDFLVHTSYQISNKDEIIITKVKCLNILTNIKML